MHEISLIKSLLAQVEAVRRREKGRGVEEIRVTIGLLSGVEPLLLRSAFAEIAPAFELPDARLIIDEVPLLAHCDACGTVEVALPRIVCPACGATNVCLVQGDELRLESVTIRRPAECEAAV